MDANLFCKAVGLGLLHSRIGSTLSFFYNLNFFNIYVGNLQVTQRKELGAFQYRVQFNRLFNEFNRYCLMSNYKSVNALFELLEINSNWFG